jgi:L-threonylcarbamoyladenylate synthase
VIRPGPVVRSSKRFDENRIIHVRAEGIVNGPDVGLESVRGNLRGAGRALPYLLDRRDDRAPVALADRERRNQLGNGIDGDEDKLIVELGRIAKPGALPLLLSKLPDFRAWLTAAAERVSVARFPWSRGQRGGLTVAETISMARDSPDPAGLQYAAEMIRAGRVIAVPTDTFYGLAADPFNLYAVEEIFQIKGRPAHKPLLLMVSSVEMAAELSSGDLPERFYTLARRFWPGPLTMVIPASRRVPLKITGNTGKVAVRVPAAAIPVSLVQTLDMPLTGTSANLAGGKQCASAAAVQECLGERLALIVDGGISAAGLPSTIVELNPQGWRLIREGAIPADLIVDFMAA